MIGNLIRDLNVYEKPREKLLAHGIENLTNVELLALILGSGGKGFSVLALARDLLKTYSDFSGLAKADIHELISQKHLGIAKSASNLTVFEIAKRAESTVSEALITITKPDQIYKIMRPIIGDKTEEHLYLLCLNTRGRLISKELITKGTINETLIEAREIYKKGARQKRTEHCSCT
jgi:DNA repair protein RadC